MIPEHDLRVAAHTTLLALQIWWLGTKKLANKIRKDKSLGQDTASFVEACQIFRERRSERDLSVVLARAEGLKQHVQDMAVALNKDSLTILSLLTWHFDAEVGSPPSPWLLHFFVQPSIYFDDICEDIHLRYTNTVASISVKGFKRKFLKLLGFVEYHVTEGAWSFV
ncbi:hypothetical protein N7448_011323 [Penicillium atrosanguineum]|nr:hypothetical protein N7448_011323 [Penicillium atrosanguineum]